MTTYVASNQLRISVSTIAAKFLTCDAPELTAEGAQHRPEAGANLVTLDARVTYGDLTVTKLHEPAADNAILRKFAKGDKLAGTSVTIQPLDADGVPIAGSEIVYTGCLLKKVTPAKSDADSNDAAITTYVFSTQGVA